MNILITGASSGIGQQLAKDYLALGNKVYCCGRNNNALNVFAETYPDTAELLCFDILDKPACSDALAKVDSLDLAILNAGTCEYIDAGNFDAELFERVVQTNLIGLANCLAAVLPLIKPGGRVALMGSSSSYLPLPRAEAYGASKAATEYLAKTLAITLRPQQINVSYIAPGFVKTPLTDRNDFPMPMRVEVEKASSEIINGLAKGKREIHFPRRFTLILKFIGGLPSLLQQVIIRKVVHSN